MTPPHRRIAGPVAAVVAASLLAGAFQGALAQSSGSVRSGDSLGPFAGEAQPQPAGTAVPPADTPFAPKGRPAASAIPANIPPAPSAQADAASQPMARPVPSEPPRPGPFAGMVPGQGLPQAQRLPQPQPQPQPQTTAQRPAMAAPQAFAQPVQRPMGGTVAPSSNPLSIPQPQAAPAAYPGMPAMPAAGDAASAAVPAPAKFQSAIDTSISDDEANRDVLNLARKMRVLDQQLKVEKSRLDVAKTQADLRKVTGEQDAASAALAARLAAAAAPPPPPVAPVPMSAFTPPKPSPEDDVAKLRKGVLVATISISGPRDDLMALMRVAGYGDVTVKRGGVLPGRIKVTSVSPGGVSVRRGDGPTVAVPFLQ